MSTETIKKAREGDRQAFAQLYLKHKDSLYRYAYFKLGNAHDAQDAVADCVADAYAGISRLKSEKAFVSWLFKILYRKCCAVLSQNSTRKDVLSLDGGVDLPVTDDHLAPELEEALALLSAEEKDIVLLSVISGYKTREIAEMLGIKHSTVRSKLSRALAKMKNYLE